MTPAPAASLVRHRVRVRGVVQGVGFRPFVHGLATALGLAGFVGNDDEGVVAEVEGDAAAVQVFVVRLRTDAPPLAVVESVEVEAVAVEPVALERAADGEGFRIVASRRTGGAVTLVPPDVAVCDECLAEVFDPSARRHRYPFTTCTHCGPRFTIVRDLPYDRPLTTMAGFPLCDACAAEYHDPADRRFHAQPLACPACGPVLRAEPGGDRGEAALLAAQRVLAGGGVVAVKGIGGFHLACDASNPDAVATLRHRKHRGEKPLAVMARDLHAVRAFATISADEERVLSGRERPVVLLRPRPGAALPEVVAPGNGGVGVMLPYSPLHHLLFAPSDPAVVAPPVLVMTSGNLSDEPICTDDDEALARLGALADAFLLHDRPIHVPCDDSVVRVLDGAELPIRRSRGYAPYPVALAVDLPPLLAAGAELKTTFCVADGRRAWLSQHLGDMGNLETLTAFDRSASQFRHLYRVTPEVLAADSHPGYLTTRWAATEAERLGVPLVRVQHHHAHVAALLAEHGAGADDEILGVAFDGTGYGTDGAIWGGEVLLASMRHAGRAAHLAPVRLPGGDAAIEHPSRSALAHLDAAGVAWDERLAPVAATPPVERGVVARQLETGFATVPTTSAGRLFDAVAALCGVRQRVGFEAQAAMELEALVDHGAAGAYAFAVSGGAGHPLVLDAAPVVRAVVDDVLAGVPVGTVAARFHRAVAAAVVAAADALRARGGPATVGLTGGVFQNVTLASLTTSALRGAGFTVLVHHRVPPNDGGLALGQAVVAGLAHGATASGDRAVTTMSDQTTTRGS